MKELLIENEFFIKPEYKGFYDKLNDVDKYKFEEITLYFDELKFEKNLILIFSQWYNDKNNMLKNFKENSGIGKLDEFLINCNKKGLLLNVLDTTTKTTSNDIKNSLVCSSKVHLID